MEFVLKNGMVVDPENHLEEQMDIRVKDGKIAEIGKNLTAEKITDYSGKWIFPGIIDSHLHLYRENAKSCYRKVVESGVTTAIDFAGPVRNIIEELPEYGYGLNVGCLEAIRKHDSHQNSEDISEEDIDYFLNRILKEGALGPKLLCGHYPITPRAIATVIQKANDRKVIVAYHAGSTETRSDLKGMREAVQLAGSNAMILAHINAYCRGNVKNVYEELEEAFRLLREHPNIISDSHLAIMNACFGLCIDGKVEDKIACNCLRANHLAETKEGILEGIEKGIVSVIQCDDEDCRLINGVEAETLFLKKDTNIGISFKVNMPCSAAACMTERRSANGEFLIEMTATDGGYIPRNKLMKRVLLYYRLGYVGLSEAIAKITTNPAHVFALKGKGALGVGCDADITIADPETLEAIASYIGGELAMQNGIAIKRAGTILITPKGIEEVDKQKVPYTVIHTENSILFEEKKEKKV